MDLYRGGIGTGVGHINGPLPWGEWDRAGTHKWTFTMGGVGQGWDMYNAVFIISWWQGVHFQWLLLLDENVISAYFSYFALRSYMIHFQSLVYDSVCISNEFCCCYLKMWSLKRVNYFGDCKYPFTLIGWLLFSTCVPVALSLFLSRPLSVIVQ